MSDADDYRKENRPVFSAADLNDAIEAAARNAVARERRRVHELLEAEILHAWPCPTCRVIRLAQTAIAAP